MKLTNLKNSIIISILSILTIGITSCASNKIKDYIAKGNDVKAIELLSQELLKNPSDEEYILLFNSVYPRAIEERIPSKSVEETINSTLSYYGPTRRIALEEIKRTLSPTSKISNHKTINNAINQAQNQIVKLKEAGRIQYCVSTIPSQVYKYSEDFSKMYEDGLRDLSVFYYDIAEIIYTDGNETFMEESYNFYKKANSSYIDSREKLSETAYNLGSLYQEKNGYDNLKKATSWYEICKSWNPNYKDVQNKSKEISYEIGKNHLASAKSTKDYEDAILYLEKAQNYKDAQDLLKEAMYLVANMYRSTNILYDYEKAGEYYIKLGNYKNVQKEASLYTFYKRLKNLSKGDTYRNTTLSSEKWNNEYSSTLSSSSFSSPYADLFINIKSSDFKVFSKINDPAIYPGMIVKGNSIVTEQFNELYVGQRYSIPYSIDAGRITITDGYLSPYNTSNINKEVKNRLNQYNSKIQPETIFKYTQIYSEDNLDEALGFGYNKNSIKYDKSIFYRDDTILLVKISQKYYTTKITDPRLPIDFFIPGENYPSSNEIGTVVPYYVSSVDYGRQAIFIITSELSKDELIRDIEILRPTNINKYSNTLYQLPQIVYRWAKNHTMISAVTPGYINNFLNTLEGMYNWINWGLYSHNSFDEIYPISFTLKNICTNEFASLSRSKKYIVKNPNYYVHNNNGKPNNNYGGNSNNINGNHSNNPNGTPNNNYPNGGNGIPNNSNGNHSNNPNGTPNNNYPNGGNGTSNNSNYPHGYSNPYINIFFIGSNGKVYSCFNRDDTTYYYEIDSVDMAYSTCTWDTSKFKQVYVNGIQMVPGKTIFDFSNVQGNTISFDYIDSNGNYIHKLLVVYRKR